jgi:2-keto-3-deoxy-6-phosphogluconate aldolase
LIFIIRKIKKIMVICVLSALELFMKTTVIDKIKQAGIIVALPGDLPLQTIVPIADALLASPILAVDVAYSGVETVQLLHDLRQRAGDKLLIGVSGVETAVHLNTLQNSPIDYLSSPRLDDGLLASCYAKGIAYMPGVISVWAAQAAGQKMCRFARLPTGGPAGADFVTAVHQVAPDLDLIVEVELTSEEVAHYKKAGAAALMIAAPIFTDSTQTIADLITQARRFTQAWQQATAVDQGLPKSYLNGSR